MDMLFLDRSLALLVKLSLVRWEELTSVDFVKALAQAQGTCVLPFGIIGKHGPAGPLGTDLIDVRFASLNAVKQEFALVFPEYYFGQIFEAKHQPGTIAYSRRLQFDLLQETTQEMARNGCRKILIVNGHGGNNALLQYFVHLQIEHAKGYVVYAFQNPAGELTGAAAASGAGVDGHAGESEISNVMASRPDLVEVLLHLVPKWSNHALPNRKSGAVCPVSNGSVDQLPCPWDPAYNRRKAQSKCTGS